MLTLTLKAFAWRYGLPYPVIGPDGIPRIEGKRRAYIICVKRKYIPAQFLAFSYNSFKKDWKIVKFTSMDRPCDLANAWKAIKAVGLRRMKAGWGRPENKAKREEHIAEQQEKPIQLYLPKNPKNKAMALQGLRGAIRFGLIKPDEAAKLYAQYPELLETDPPVKAVLESSTDRLESTQKRIKSTC